MQLAIFLVGWETLFIKARGKGIEFLVKVLLPLSFELPRIFVELIVHLFVRGVVSRNPRNFRHPRSSPATRASRSIILPSLWKV